MKSTYIKLIAVSLILSCTAALTACSSSSTSSDASTGNVGDTTPVSETSSTSSEAANSESKTDSSSEDTKSSDENKSGENSTESTVTYEYVKDGMPKDWKLASASIAYQFASTDEYNENKFNLVVSKTNSPIEDVTSEQMTATYKATMEDFKLVDFQHTEIAGKKAIYMQLTGMVSQVTKQTTITQYMIQSGEDAYCFSFTQSTEDETFPDLIAGVIDSLEIK